jgi:hypothetical protein
MKLSIMNLNRILLMRILLMGENTHCPTNTWGCGKPYPTGSLELYTVKPVLKDHPKNTQKWVS